MCVRLSLLEKLGALHGDLRVPLSAVASASACDAPWQQRPWRGLRVGTGLPWVFLLGRTVSLSSVDFCAVYGRGPALVLTLHGGHGFRCVVLTCADAEQLAQRINAALPPKPAAPMRET